MTGKPSIDLFRNASKCGREMIEGYNHARFSCLVYCRDLPSSRQLPGVSERGPEAVRNTRWATFFERQRALADAYDLVADWWVGHEPPPFEPRAASALEGILWWSTRLLVHLCNDDPWDLPEHLDAAVRLVLAHCPKLPTPEVTALLRTETQRLLDGWPRLIPQPGGSPCNADFIESQCDDQATELLPDGWYALTVEERIAAVREDGAVEWARYNRLMELALPSWESESSTLKVGVENVKEFLSGPPPKNQTTILNAMQAAGWPEKQLVAVPGLKGDALRNAAREIRRYLRKKGIRFRSVPSGHVEWERGGRKY